MAAGAYDANGVWLYGEDDSQSTFSALLNIGQDSVSDAIGLDRARITALETSNALGGVSGSVFTVATGWSFISQNARKKNGMVFWRIRFARTGAAVTVPSDGNIANQLIATIATGWTPASGAGYIATAMETGPACFGAVTDSSGFGVYMTAVAPGITIATSSEFSMGGVYPLA